MAYRPTFLNTRTPEEAFPTVLDIFKRNDCLISHVHKDLGVSYAHLMRWLRDNPRLHQKLRDAARKEMEL
jgi:hypothetical protein